MLSRQAHVYSEILLHFNWHCHSDMPLILPEREEFLHRSIQEYVDSLKGAKFLGAGGIETHVHLLVQLEPNWAPGDFIGKVKGASSHSMNHQFGSGTMQWQRGYGVVSFAKANLGGLMKYVQKQREHHGRGTTRDKLELYDTYDDDGE